MTHPVANMTHCVTTLPYETEISLARNSIAYNIPGYQAPNQFRGEYMRLTTVTVMLTLACTSAFGAVADDIKALMEQNKPAEAYQLGKSNPDQMGDPIFDFFFGISALDAGAPGEGVLALERYALSFPDNRNARFHLARGYYILGEDQRARDEFEALRPDASGEELAGIERYLDAIRARESRYQPTANFWIETGFGYDNNINSGVKADSQLNIPGVGNFVPLGNSVSVRESDWLYTVAAGVQGTRPVAPGIALYGAAGFDTRRYMQSNNDQFDQLNFAGNGGVSILSGKNLFRAGAAIQQQRVYSQNYLLTYGLTGDWAHQFNQFDRINLGVFIGRQNYSDMQVWAFKDKDETFTNAERVNSGANLKDSNYSGLSLGWTHAFGVTWQPVLAVSAGLSRESNRENRDDFTRNIFSTRVQVSLTPAPRWGVSVGLGYQRADYQDNFSQIASESQLDNNYNFDSVVSYRINRNWSARGELTVAKQRSNIDLFDYSRAAAGAKIRYEFN